MNAVHLESYSVAEVTSTTIQDADLFLSMLLEFSSLGAAMRRVMASTLTNPQVKTNAGLLT